MASPDGFLTEEQRHLLRSMSFGSNSGSEVPSPRSTSELIKHGSTGSGKAAAPGALKHDRRSHSGKLGRPKKGGAGGRGTWGSLLDSDGQVRIDRNDPNYDSDEAQRKLNNKICDFNHMVLEMKRQITEFNEGRTLDNEFTILAVGAGGNAIVTKVDCFEAECCPLPHSILLKRELM